MEFDGPRKTPVVFYRTPAGGAVVLDWLKGLANGERAVIGQDLMRVQFRWPVGSLSVGRWATVSGKCAAIVRATVSRGCCSASSMARSSCCTASSRRRKRLRTMT